MTTQLPDPGPTAMPYPPDTAPLADTHTAIKNLATAADTALTSSAVFLTSRAVTTNASGDGSITTDLKTFTGGVLTHYYSTGAPYPWIPVFAIMSFANGVLGFRAYQGMNTAAWVGKCYVCLIAWGTR